MSSKLRLPDRIRRHHAANGAGAAPTPAVTAGTVPGSDPGTTGPVPDAPRESGGEACSDTTTAGALAAAQPGHGLLPLLARLRVERGLGVDDVARQLHVPVAVLRELESGALLATGAPVFVRGLLKSYARLLAVPVDAFQSAPLPEVAEPALVAALPAARQRPLAGFLNPSLYVLLTAVVLVPLLYLAAPERQPSAPPADLASLDAGAQEVAIAAVPASASAAPGLPASAAPAPEQLAMGPPEPIARMRPAESRPAPMMASMAPVGERSPAATTRRVVLTLSNESWVQFLGADGRRLEYALLPAGTRREYQLFGRADLVIGNARGAVLDVDGERVDLTPHTRANLARVALGRE